MLVLCQKLYICTYDIHIFFGDRLPFGDHALPPLPSKVEVLKLPLVVVYNYVCEVST